MNLPTLRQLQYLVLLVRHGSFVAAARAANVSQPTLSAGIRALEEVLGGAVVDRGQGGVILTPLGADAVRRAEDLLTRAEDMVRTARADGRPLGGPFRLGIIPTVAPFLLPRALPLLRRRFPELQLSLREDLTRRLKRDLAAGEIDAALIALPYDTRGLDYMAIGEDSLMAVLPPNHPGAGARQVAANTLIGQNLILLEDGHCLRDHALAACELAARQDGRQDGQQDGRRTISSVSSLHTLVPMVAAGLGVSLLPKLAVDAGIAEASEVAIRPLDPPANRTLVIAWRAESSRAAEGRLLAETLGEA